LETLTSLGPTNKSFAKILLDGKPGSTLFNTFVHTKRLYVDPLNELTTLDISFETPDGELYDFGGLDHSFTIELCTVGDTPGGTAFSTNTNKNYNIPTL
jgi:hypothetical protein